MQIASVVAIRVGDNVTFTRPVVESVGHNEAVCIKPWHANCNRFQYVVPIIIVANLRHILDLDIVMLNAVEMPSHSSMTDNPINLGYLHGHCAVIIPGE